MPSIEVPTDVLAELHSDSWQTLREAVERAGRLLRSKALDDDETERLHVRLFDLTAHPKWEVRKAVVDVIHRLQDERYETALARLLADDNSFVRDTAERALARRAALSRTDLLKHDHAELVASWLADLARSHGPRARDAAMRVARKYAEVLIGEVHHELVRVISKLELSLVNLDTKLAKKRPDIDECRRHTGNARSRVKQLTAILKLLRQVTSEIVPSFGNEPLRQVIEESLTLVDETLRSRADVEIDVDDDILVEMDRALLVSAFTNVLQNAFEAVEGTRATVEVTARVREQQLVIRFEDNGCGMPEEVRRDAFRLFSTGKREHLGFGLPLARTLIGAHGGEIALTSKKGQGTTVTVVLPLEQGRE